MIFQHGAIRDMTVSVAWEYKCAWMRQTVGIQGGVWLYFWKLHDSMQPTALVPDTHALQKPSHPL